MPVAPDVSEAPVAERTSGLPPDAIQVGESTVIAASAHVLLKAACHACGISTSGNRGQLWKRLGEHVLHQEALTAHNVAHTLQRETTRQPLQQSIAIQPSEKQVHEHNLTHYPYQEWCPARVCFKGRQDQRPSTADHSDSSVTVISLDYGFSA